MFDVGKVHKLQDRLESEATEWMSWRVCENYDIEEIEELTEGQVNEIEEYLETDGVDPYVYTALRNVINQWECEND